MITKELKRIVGDQYVADDARTLKAYSSDFSLSKPNMPHYVVKPATTEEVQKIIQLAGSKKTPLIPASSQVHFYGATIPTQGGIVVDMCRMNKITDLDEGHRKIQVGVGATWEQLTSTLEKKDYRLITPLLPHALRSPVTDYLEREMPVEVIYEFAEPLGTMEVVWPNGELFRTGSASVPGYPKSVSKGANPSGPGIDFYRLLQGAQGTMGIVTWANLKIEYLPKVNRIYFMPLDAIEEAIDPIYCIPRRRIGQEFLLLDRLNLALILAEGSDGEFRSILKALPPWMLILVISGGRRQPEGRVAYEEEALMEARNKEFPNTQILPAVSGVTGGGRKLVNMLRKPWKKDLTYWKLAYKGGCQSLFFLARPVDAPGYIEAVTNAAARVRFPREQIGIYLQPVEQSRACHLEFDFYYRPKDAGEVGQVTELYSSAAEALLDKGAFFSRPYNMLADLVYERAGMYASVMKRVKKIWDPNNIMNPGKLCF